MKLLGVCLIIMHQSRYKTVNTFSKPPNVNQFIACFVIIALFVVFFTAVQNNIHNQQDRLTVISLFSATFVLLVVSTLFSCHIDPVDQIIPIYHSTDRASIAKQLHKCLYCQSCQSYVLESSRHCKICERCVGDFDHHCIWINNCIGKKNYKPFLLMISSATTYLVLFAASVSILWAEGNWHSFIASMVVSWIFLITAALFALPLTVLVCLHCYLSWNGVTTYEFIMNKRIKEIREKPKEQNPQNVTQNLPFSRNNKVGVQVDQIIFHPPLDLQTLEHKQNSQNSDAHEKSESKSIKEKEHSQDIVSNEQTLKKGTVPVQPLLQIKQFYKNHKSLKLLIGNAIEVEQAMPSRRQFSFKRQSKQTRIITVQTLKVDQS